jgi:tyrosyl-tRNA synthetase
MKSSKKPNREEAVNHLLSRGVEEIIDPGHLEEALRSGRRLRVKFGIDPTKPDLHLGHAVILRKLREFQNLGHKIILIIGDFTAAIGDPSGRSETRKPLSEKEVVFNSKKYLEQLGKILDIKKAEIHRNSEWHKKDGLVSFLKLASSASIQQVLRREDFRKRIEEENDITLLEALYPLLQGYDSVKIKADVELGGLDQKFNLLMGRRVQRFYGLSEQDVMMFPLLEGTDGVRKMSKSYDNYIGLNESGEEMFGKIMSIPDELITKYFILCTDVAGEEIIRTEKEMAEGGLNPRDAKARLAYEIVKIYHGERAAQKAEEEFNEVFREKKLPEEIKEFRVGAAEISLIDALLLTKLAKSKSEARRLIEQGAVRVNQGGISDLNYKISFSGQSVILQVGSRRFGKIFYNK